jgi:hypothetical protein
LPCHSDGSVVSVAQGPLTKEAHLGSTSLGHLSQRASIWPCHFGVLAVDTAIGMAAPMANTAPAYHPGW